ncbi:MAG TPA: bifunctional hydroxymethylpyrimidine kinase/phosphomethylpyrimidine kinase [Chloroflexota bacterium]|nr:bifunctional hydroxymethylpyrimidine kinase/phosphomethylpyrimidine kinase [Chloroflexota bacterium]
MTASCSSEPGDPRGGPSLARALTIAGSDSGGGAGIQADLKTFAALGVYGASALTAVTAQNTCAVTAVHEVPAAIVVAQIDAVLEDIGADAVKTGMLASGPIIQAVAACLRRHQIRTLVVDPVLVAKSGDRLLREDAVRPLCETLLPLSLIVTPNIPEAAALAGLALAPALARVPAGDHLAAGATADDDALCALGEMARRIAAYGPRYVLIKGGHLAGPPVDYLWDGERFTTFPGDRVMTSSTHGTGCTLSAAIAAHLARGASVHDAVAGAKAYVGEALRRAQPIGHGHGPLHHLWMLSRQAEYPAADH